MAEVTGGAPPNRGSAFDLAGIAGVSRSDIRLVADELVRWPFPRSVRAEHPLGERTA